jgi:hypothetical protein
MGSDSWFGEAMRSIRTTAIAVAAGIAVGLTGCGGGGAEVKTTTTTVSIGQQLIDLKQAREAGAISQSEYERLKRDLINRVLD